MPAAPTTNPISPLTRLRRLRRNILGGIVVVIAIASLWSVQPRPAAPPLPPQPAPAPLVKPAQSQSATSQLNLVAFGAPIWDPPPPPPKAPAPAPPPPPPPPVRLQLLGIACDGSVRPGEPDAFLAALYDEAQDKVLVVKKGDAIGTAKVITVSIEAVELSDTYGTRRLALRPQTHLPASQLLDYLSAPIPIPAPRQSERSQ